MGNTSRVVMNVCRQRQIKRGTDTHSDGILTLEGHSLPIICPLLTENKLIFEVILYFSSAEDHSELKFYHQMDFLQ
jgi:hypothetical protein